MKLVEERDGIAVGNTNHSAFENLSPGGKARENEASRSNQRMLE
jgi:hypothetical protein